MAAHVAALRNWRWREGRARRRLVGSADHDAAGPTGNADHDAARQAAAGRLPRPGEADGPAGGGVGQTGTRRATEPSWRRSRRSSAAPAPWRARPLRGARNRVPRGWAPAAWGRCPPWR
ncbi:hypothetical protein QJS66_10005 [Kocuria rhizophila]|nr:hypothetical protein QJS66_10005 [Kocuria rhizophila]